MKTSQLEAPVMGRFFAGEFQLAARTSSQCWHKQLSGSEDVRRTDAPNNDGDATPATKGAWVNHPLSRVHIVSGLSFDRSTHSATRRGSRFLIMMAMVSQHLETIAFAYNEKAEMPHYMLARRTFPRLLFTALMYARSKGEFLHPRRLHSGRPGENITRVCV